jgi:hypothetical protein
MVRPSCLSVRWLFLRHDSERWFEDVRSIVIRHGLTQRFRYFVAINEIAKATTGPMPKGGVPAFPLGDLLHELDDGRKGRDYPSQRLKDRMKGRS